MRVSRGEFRCAVKKCSLNLGANLDFVNQKDQFANNVNTRK